MKHMILILSFCEFVLLLFIINVIWSICLFLLSYFIIYCIFFISNSIFVARNLDLGSDFNMSLCFSKNVCILSAVLWSGKRVSSIKYAFAFSVYYNCSEHCMTTWHSMINCITYIGLFCIKCKINKSLLFCNGKYISRDLLM